MLDANLRYGVKRNAAVFVQVGIGCDYLQFRGLDKGKVYFAIKLEGDFLKVKHFGGWTVIKHDDNSEGYLSYAGNGDLTGFIDEHTRSKASEFFK
jgi:hypothetical protein